jgi:hypothetical protein
VVLIAVHRLQDRQRPCVGRNAARRKHLRPASQKSKVLAITLGEQVGRDFF